MQAGKELPRAAQAPADLSSLRAELTRRLDQAELELPLLPGVALEVTSAAAREDVDARVLADLLKRDAAMAAHVLRVVNSPLYSARGQVVSLQQAVARVGAAKIREIALIVACKASVFKVPGYEAEVSAVFEHSIAAALTGQEIARATRNNVEDAFLCGLLHDIGRPVLLQTLVGLAREQRVSLEREGLLELTSELHCRAGAALASAWKLPEAVIGAITHHHSAVPEHVAAVHITALGDAAAHAVLDGAEDPAALLASHPSLSLLEIYPDVLQRILGKVASVRETAKALS
ncbi:MAG: HDOD domain-containing protein [Polyangiaceae bacterium]